MTDENKPYEIKIVFIGMTKTMGEVFPGIKDTEYADPNYVNEITGIEFADGPVTGAYREKYRLLHARQPHLDIFSKACLNASIIYITSSQFDATFGLEKGILQSSKTGGSRIVIVCDANKSVDDYQKYVTEGTGFATSVVNDEKGAIQKEYEIKRQEILQQDTLNKMQAQEDKKPQPTGFKSAFLEPANMPPSTVAMTAALNTIPTNKISDPKNELVEIIKQIVAEEKDEFLKTLTPTKRIPTGIEQMQKLLASKSLKPGAVLERAIKISEDRLKILFQPGRNVFTKKLYEALKKIDITKPNGSSLTNGKTELEGLLEKVNEGVKVIELNVAKTAGGQKHGRGGQVNKNPNNADGENKPQTPLR